MRYVILAFLVIVVIVFYLNITNSSSQSPAEIVYSQGIFAQSTDELSSKCNLFLKTYPESGEKSLDDLKRSVKIVEDVKIDGTSFTAKGWSKNHQDVFGIDLVGDVIVDDKYSFSATCHVRSNGISSVFIDSHPLTSIEQGK